MSKAEERNNKQPAEEEGFPTASISGSGGGRGEQIGPYKLLSVLGEGGCGVVYLAEREKPVKRRVALKIIKPGMDSKQVIARFEAERQALALLNHPNIAQVYNAGTTEAGRLYFVMEYVKGVPIIEHCDRQKLSVEERLELFLQVCDAIGHAHQKGIIHRDIKPSNILVLFEGQKALPKVIDFGVAKAISQPLTDRTLFTEHGQLLGTPEYMSPEQAEMTTQDIDTRSDIYSLGVLLYELLTGTLPFDRKTLEKAGFGEIQRIIREQDPPRPSTRLSSLGEEATKIAQSRRMEVSTLTKQLHKELEWIPLKAMRKERTHRYRSASELSDDIQNYLKGVPLIAGPESTAYRVRKFMRRNRALVTATAAVAAAIIVGLVVSTAMYFQAEKARGIAEEARTAEAQQRQIAEAETKRAKELAETQRKQLYFNHIALADVAYRDTNIHRLRELLESCPADLRGWEWYRLNHIFDQARMTIRGHESAVACVAFSPDGKRIVSGSVDKTIKVWDAATGAELMTLRGHEGDVTCVLFSPDGKHIVSGSDDKTVKVWDTATGAELMTLRGHSDKVWSVAFSRDGRRIVSGGKDNTIKLWDGSTGAEVMTLRGHSDMVWWVAFSPDGERIISGSRDGTARVWGAATGAEVMTLRVGSDVASFVLSPDGKRVISGSDDGTITVWDAATGDELMTLRGHSGIVWSVAFSPDGKRIVSSGFYDHMINIWDVESGAAIATLRGHKGFITCVAFSPDGERIVSSGGGWDISEHTIKVWDVATSPEKMSLRGHKDWVSSVAFSPDGEHIVSGSKDNMIKLWNVRTGAELMTLRGHEGWVRAVSFSPDGKRIVSGSDDNTIKVWDEASGEELMALRGHEGWVHTVGFNPDGERIVSGSGDKTIRIWDIESGEQVRKISGHDGAVFSAAFSPDGKRIVSSSEDKTVRVWDAATGAELMTLCGHAYPVYAVAFSPDGKRIASGSGDRTVKVWDATTGAEVMLLHGHYWDVSCVAFSPDGKRIISGSLAGTVKVWDSATGTELMTLRRHKDFAWSVAFSPDGKTIAIGTSNGNITLWESAPPAGGYGPRRTAEAARKLVDELYEEYGFYSEVIDKLKADKVLDEAVRKVALQIANSRLWEDAEKLKKQSSESAGPEEGAAEQKTEGMSNIECQNPKQIQISKYKIQNEILRFAQNDKF